jgi:hypothetical protein
MWWSAKAACVSAEPELMPITSAPASVKISWLSNHAVLEMLMRTQPCAPAPKISSSKFRADVPTSAPWSAAVARSEKRILIIENDSGVTVRIWQFLEGRRPEQRYTVEAHLPLPESVGRGLAIGDLLPLLAGDGAAIERPRCAPPAHARHAAGGSGHAKTWRWCLLVPVVVEVRVRVTAPAKF